ncbi:MAG TPA: sigma-54 dependent transcriptional regulator [Terriglobia bacterium]|nr:sigma-54 dependent transcriptional regulator [Terriglobia bacterium]
MKAPGTESSIAATFEKQALAKLVGEAPSFVKVIEDLPGLACSDATVLIEGETGTGKELVARALHYLGPRASSPFIPVNCGAFSDTLLQDELFGHERGAFTDALGQRQGLIAQAEKGTLFLDEVDSLSPRAQVALLRVLQDGMFRSLGGTREQHVDVRFVAATNTPLFPLIETGAFRRDLYYRLCVFSLSLPPLRARGSDVVRLATYFIRKHEKTGAPSPQLSYSACSALLAFDWPGNVRELENAIIRGVQRCRTGFIEAADLGLTPAAQSNEPSIAQRFSTGASFKDRKKQLIETFERQFLIEVLSEHHGNVSRAAQAAGRERRDFGKLLKKYQIDPRLFAGSMQNLPTVPR